MKKRRLLLPCLLLAVFLLTIIFVPASGCTLFQGKDKVPENKTQQQDISADTKTDTGGIEDKETAMQGPPPPSHTAEEEDSAVVPVNSGGSYKIAYFEVGMDELSSHFEHRVAQIYSVSPDGSNKALIYSDINEKYDLSRIYGVSADNKKISCGFYEGGRGAYSALAVIDTSAGTLSKVIDFDYTDDGSQQLLSDIYGIPVWSNDGSLVAFEIISGMFTNNIRSAGVKIANVETGEIKDADLGIEGLSARSTTFLNPVLFSADDQNLYMINRVYHEKKEDGQVLDLVSRDDSLVLSDMSNKNMKSIISANDFAQELIKFNNFKILINNNSSKLLFEALGDFEEDGDLWICDSDGRNLQSLTNNTDLREQQPSVFNSTSSPSMIAYIGSSRYGTIGSEIPSGDLYVMGPDGSNNKKLTEYNVGASKPVFSPDGRYIAFMHHIYDENVEYVISRQIEVFDFVTGQVNIVVSGTGIFDLAGWIKTD